MAPVAKRIAIVAGGLVALGAVYLGTRTPSPKGSERGSEPAPPEQPATPAAPQASREATEQAEREAFRHNQLAIYRGLPPAERLEEMARRCPNEGQCDKDALALITQAASTDAERATLSSRAQAMTAGQQRGPEAQQAAPIVAPPVAQQQQPTAGGSATVPGREAFAQKFEAALVERRLNPDSVSVTGPNKTTLEIKGFACVRDFLSNVAKSPLGAEARAAGFKRLTCSYEQITDAVDL
jgi:hypothetical protein